MEIVFAIFAVYASVLLFLAIRYWRTRAIIQKLTKEDSGNAVFVSPYNHLFFVINFESRTVKIGRPTLLSIKEFSISKKYGFDQISGCELKQNDVTATSTNRGSQVAGAAVGALAFGGIGALIGGLSGSSTSRKRVHDVSVYLRVQDTSQPSYRMILYRSFHGATGLSLSLKSALKDAERLLAHMTNVLKQSSSSVQNASRHNVTAELERLAQLKSSGMITDEEFRSAKRRVLPN